ncbi:MAG: hypothetical protein AB7S26_10105 [Sandaracinaceae bacterium]
MTKNALLIVCCLAVGALTGCDDGGGTDAGSGMDSGARDGGARRDAGGGNTDPCASDDDPATTSRGCNGPLYGSTSMANEIDGACTPDMVDGPGSCNAGPAGIDVYCAPDEVDPTMGTCLYFCPEAGTYVSTGGCPSGTRCFTLDGFALCFRDCNTAADCFPGEECDGDGSCVPPAPPDGGVGDGGMTMGDAGGPMDGGVADGG